MFKQAPSTWKLDSLCKYINEVGCSAEVDGKWVPARPMGFFSIPSRLRAAWKVFTGKADALTWPGQ